IHPALLHHRREIVEHEHRDDPRHCARRAQINVADQGMRMWAARESSGQSARSCNIIDKAAFARHQRLVFEAKNACADCAHPHWPALDIALAALERTSLGVAYTSASKASIVAALTGWISKLSFCASARKSASRIVASKAAVSADLRSAAISGGAANGRAMAWLANNSLMICSCSGFLTISVASGTPAI